MAGGFEVDRFCKALRLADSNHPGERDGAFAACDRVLKAAGMTWGDLSRRIEKPSRMGHRRGSSAASANEAALRARAEQAERQIARMQVNYQRLTEDLDVVTKDNQRLRHDLVEVARERDRMALLQTPDARRKAVLQLLKEGGWSDRAIARELGVSPQTVGNLRRHSGATPSGSRRSQ